MNTTAISLYDIVRYDLKLDDNRAKLFVAVFQISIRDTVHQLLAEFQNPIIELKAQIKEDMHKLELKFESSKNDSDKKYDSLKRDFDLKFESFKNEMIKWYVGSFITMFITFLCLFFTNWHN